VVTTDGPAGRFGVTVSAVASVSADPPMLLVCINQRSPALAAIQANGIFTVNLLAETQSHVADSFAGRAPQKFDFTCARWAQDHTVLPPRLEGAAAAFHCSIASLHEAGSHAVLIGHVLNAFAGAAAPLAYVAQGYASTAPLHANAA
jgi:flavin reductase (DIM6/NTAB) family NADH-FMN oxidoreductase RutF